MEGLLTFLGSGTSMGVPSVGCECKVCTSTDPHDKRLRPSVLVQWTEPATGVRRSIVIDTGPDFREQALRAGLKRVDAVFYTHGHADHILGMDDLRPLSFTAAREVGPIPLYAAPETSAILQKIFDYTFSPNATYTNRARVELKPLAEHNLVHGVDFLRIPVRHGEQQIDGFRFGRAAYITDVSTIPESSFALLEGVEVLVVSALRHVPHPSHATVEQALGWAKRIGAQQTWFTHIAHDLGHEETNRTLPENVKLAYDGLTVPITL
ncbi:MAG TPA: MBL fold metallo-hydrolase [Terracidiphilus sp.]|jgi:phosphoribosyl 1,2-cyclic phosphate phosphodiesterase|nr:MBL fold metallo-hydrolase [Terracidiphilus sp.]